MRTSPVKSYKTSAHSPAGSSFLRGGGGGGAGGVEAGEESEVTRLTGGGANCFLWGAAPDEDEGGRKDDGLAKGWFEFLEGFLTDVKKPLAEDTVHVAAEASEKRLAIELSRRRDMGTDPGRAQ
jgi:hypothetical protein